MSARLPVRIIAVIALLASSRVDAQCADGSAPPCRQVSGARAVSLDANRVVVMPFRVTTADSLFGEGFAELLALEFTGEGGLRAIDMSTTLATWRRAGGGLRTPLTQDDALRIARQLGAGVLCQGTIIGVGGRLTISASLVDATSGRAIGRPARATGSADSVDVLLGQVATGLLGASTRVRPAEAGGLTKSPAALRAYFEGLAMRRRGDRDGAARAFEASFAADTMFASAAFQRWLISRLLQLVDNPEWVRRTLALKDRLTPSERTMVDGSFGFNPGTPRTRRQINADLLQAALRVDSPEAWHLYGDDVYHNGLSVVGPDSVLPLARAAFERALALDSLPLSIGHLGTIAVRTRDSSLSRRLARVVDKLDGEDRWAGGWKIAAAQRDTAQLARLRRIGPHAQPTQFSGIALVDLLDTPAPLALIEAGFRQLNAVTSEAERNRNAGFLWLIHRARGQPSAAERSAAGHPAPHWRAAIDFEVWSPLSGDFRDDETFMRAFGREPLDIPAAERRRQCMLARLAAQRGRADSLDIRALRERAGDRCGRLLEIWKAFAMRVVTDAELMELDSIVTVSTSATFGGFEHRLLSSIYEARGDTARALRAIRLYPRDFAGVWLAPTLREEGRAYLLARDTASALRSYQHFLALRAEAEPRYVPERDSIRTLVATLTRRRERQR